MRGGLSTWYGLTGRYHDWETGAGRAAARFRAALAAGEGKADPYLWVALGYVLGHEASAVALQGRYDHAHRLLDEADTLAGETGDVHLKAEHASVRALLLHRRGDLRAARQQLEEALALARAARAPRLEAADLWRLGLCALDAGDDPGAHAYLERALALYRALDDHLGEAAVRAYQGALARERGDIAAAQRLLDDTVRVFRAFRYRALEWFALYQLGLVCDEGMGRHTAAEGYIAQALRLAREMGDRQSEAVTRAYQGRNALYQGDLVRAQAAFEEALAICREIGSQVGVGLAERGLGLLAHYRGDERQARAWARQALAVARETGQRRLERGALRLLGHALAGLGELTGAAVAYQQARELDRVLGTTHPACETTADLARVALAQGDLNQAAADVATIMDALRDADLAGAEEPVAVYLTCYHVLRAGRSPQAEDALAAGYALLRERAAQFAADDQRRQFLENIPAHRDLLRAWRAHGQACAGALS
jgi:tetratricopeptide (TPR) repeat protein